MKLAYLILCHKDPDQVVKLVDRLNDSDDFFVIHVDQRSPPRVANALRSYFHGYQNVFFAKPHRCYWGQFGIIRATLSCIAEALKREFGYAVLISGQDYPLKSNLHIRQFLTKHSGREFIDAFSLREPNRWSNQAGLYSPEFRSLGFVLSFRSRIVFTRMRRKFPLNYTPHGGSQWWCLSRSAIEYVAKFIGNNPTFARHFAFSHIPDETFFQTILGNSPFNQSLAPSVTYVDWDQPAPPYPKILDEGDLLSLQGEAWLFGRKFDPKQSRSLLELLERPAQPTPQAGVA